VINIKIEHEKEIIEKNNNRLVSKTKNPNMLSAAFMIFIFPIISIFSGVFIGGYIGKSIGASIKFSELIGGLVTFALAVVIIKLFDKSLKSNENTEKIYWDDL